MRQLKWSRNKTGTLNGKVGHITLLCVSYYKERGYFVAPKLPGLNKTIPVSSEEEGQRKAEQLYQSYFNFLEGAQWNISLSPEGTTTSRNSHPSSSSRRLIPPRGREQFTKIKTP